MLRPFNEEVESQMAEGASVDAAATTALSARLDRIERWSTRNRPLEEVSR
jgi:hypothetical protein